MLDEYTILMTTVIIVKSSLHANTGSITNCALDRIKGSYILYRKLMNGHLLKCAANKLFS